MEALLAAAAALIEATAFGAWAKGSALAYPVANVVHLLGLVLLVGGIGLLDLRLLGFFRALPLGALSAAVTPLGVAGLLLMIGSGITMFAADATAFARAPMFQWKLALAAIAIANAVVFRLMVSPRMGNDRPGVAARTMASASIGLWLTVAALGRLVAYN